MNISTPSHGMKRHLRLHVCYKSENVLQLFKIVKTFRLHEHLIGSQSLSKVAFQHVEHFISTARHCRRTPGMKITIVFQQHHSAWKVEMAKGCPHKNRNSKHRSASTFRIVRCSRPAVNSEISVFRHLSMILKIKYDGRRNGIQMFSFTLLMYCVYISNIAHSL